MVKFIRHLKKWNATQPILGFVIGGILGFAYYYFIGCSSGTCPITSSPWGSITTGSIIGLLVAS